LILGLAVWVSARVYKVSDFQGKIFKFNNIASGVYEVDVGLGSVNGFLSAYGDFNGDKSVDMVVLDQLQQNINIYYWSTSTRE
jgi:hypothetical protein